MRHGHQLSVGFRSQPDTLPGFGPVAEGEHLLPCQDDRTDRFSASAPMTAKASWYWGRRPEPNAPPTKALRTVTLFLDRPKMRDVPAAVLRTLGLVVDRQMAVITVDNGAGVHFHRVVVLDAAVELQVHLDGRCLEGGRRVAGGPGRR